MPSPPTEFGAPVRVPPMTAGQDARAANAQARGALATANHRLVDDRAFYLSVCAALSVHTPAATDRLARA